MSKIEPADQIRFLVSCIMHSGPVKPDFAAVAEEQGIVTKAAAQKRYERMLKAISAESPKPASKASDGEGEKPLATPTKKRKTAAPTTGSAQKKGRGRPPKNKPNGDDAKPAEAEEEKKDVKNDDGEESPLSDPPSTLNADD